MSSQPPPAVASAVANSRSRSGLNDCTRLDQASLRLLVPHITDPVALATIATLAESAYYTVGQLRRRADTTAGFTELGLLPGIVDAFDIYCQPERHSAHCANPSAAPACLPACPSHLMTRPLNRL